MGPELNQPLNPASRPSPAPQRAAAQPATPAKPEINQVTGFFDGFVKEGVQAAAGLYTLVTTNPLTTAKGLVYMATHPGQAVSAIVNPYVVAHQQGRYGELAGRASFQVLSMVLSSGTLSKKGATAKVAEPTAAMSQQAANVAEKMAGRIGADKAARVLAEQGVQAGTQGYAKQLATLTKTFTQDVSASMTQRGIADKLARQLAASGLDDAAIAQITAAAGKKSVEQAHWFMVSGAKNGVPAAELLKKLGEEGAKKNLAATTQAMVMGLRNDKLIKAATGTRHAIAIAEQIQRYDRLIASSKNQTLEAAYKAQQAQLIAAVQAEPRVAQLVGKVLKGEPLGQFERIGAGIGAGVDDVGQVIGGGFQRVGDTGKAIKNSLDRPLTVGDYVRGIGYIPQAIGGAIDGTVRGVGKFLRDGLSNIPIPTIKLPEIRWDKIAALPAPTPWDLITSPVVVPIKTLGWAWTHPGKAIGFGTILGNAANLSANGIRASKGEDITGAGAFYRANLARMVDGELDRLTQLTGELESLRMQLEPMTASEVLKSRDALEKNYGLDLSKAPKEAVAFKAFVMKQLDETFRKVADEREGVRKFHAQLEELSDAQLLAARPKFEEMGISVAARPGEADAYKAALLGLVDELAAKASGDKQQKLKKLHQELTKMPAEQVLASKPGFDEQGLEVSLETPEPEAASGSQADAEAFKVAVLKQIDAALARAQGPEKDKLSQLKAALTAAPAAEVLAARAELENMGLKLSGRAQAPTGPDRSAGPTTPEAEAYKAAILQTIDRQMGQATGPDKARLAQLKTMLGGAPAAEILAAKADLEKMGLSVAAPAQTVRPGQTPTPYTVRPGDTLTDIAVNQMGNYQAWQQIQQANQGRYPTLANNPDYIQSGWQLQLPGRQAQPQAPAPVTPAPAMPAPPAPVGAPVDPQRTQVVAQFGLEDSDANWANFQAEVASYKTQAVGPDAGSKADVQALQQLLMKLGFDQIQATGDFVEKDAQGKPKLDAQGQVVSPTGMAVVAFKRLAGLTQSYNVMGPDGKPAPDVNPYADTTTITAMGIALRLLQDQNLRSERASEATVKEAARLAKEAIGPDSGSLADRQAVQYALVAAGYQVPTSGEFDQATLEAVIDFKRKNNLTASFTNDRGEPVFTPYLDQREAAVLLNGKPTAQ